jgi:hypothetical protein
MNSMSMIDADRAFKTIATLSCCGLVLSFCLMALGMDLNTGWL